MHEQGPAGSLYFSGRTCADYRSVLAKHAAPCLRYVPRRKRFFPFRALHSATVQELLSTAVKSCSLQDQSNVDTDSAVPLSVALSGCHPEKQAPLKVALLLSGGVDSSLALHLLRKAGHEVTAFYLQIWFQEDFRNFWGACPWEEDLEFCQKVCRAEGVSLHVVPFTKQYWSRVVEDSVEKIKQGHTPNPDILCNSRIKFGAFYEFLEAEHHGKFERVASGHYARLIRSPVDGTPAKLAMTPDALKDQTYFLADLSQKQLSQAMFPLGSLTKAQVRRLAAEAKIPSQSRKDSQGICFLGKVKFEEFVREHLGSWPGPLVDEESGQVVGFHDGYWFYTPGQRKGILLSGGPWYVSKKDPRRNVVYISRHYYTKGKQRRVFQCILAHWISGNPPPLTAMRCKTRHGPQMYGCSVICGTTAAEPMTIRLDSDDQGLAPGQYVVFYDSDICLGTAVIHKAFTAEPEWLSQTQATAEGMKIQRLDTRLSL